MRPLQLLRALVVSGGLLCACSDSVGPAPSLVDTWALLSFTDHGTVGTTTGTMTFTPGNTFEVLGTVTYPGEPEDSIHVNGTYLVSGTTVTLTVGIDTGVWDVHWTGSRYILTLRGPQPTNQMVLGPIP